MLATIALALAAALLGLAFCVAGYRIFMVMLPILGFFAGFWIGAFAIALVLGEGFLASTASLAVGIVIGAIAAALSYVFYMAGVIIVAGALGGAIGSGIMSALGFEPGLVMGMVTLLCVILAAGLTVLLSLQKLVIMLLTSMAGASMLLLTGVLAFGQVTLAELQAGGNYLLPISQGSWFWGLVWLALVACGVYVQFRTSADYEFAKEMFVEGWG